MNSRNRIIGRMMFLSGSTPKTLEHTENGLIVRYRVDSFPFPVEYASCGKDSDDSENSVIESIDSAFE